MHLCIGNSSGVASPFVYSSAFAPTYRTSYMISICLLCVSLVLNIVLHLHFKRQNKLRDEGKQDHIMEGLDDIQIEGLGEKSPRFRFAV